MALLVTSSVAIVDHDEWEFYGGQRIRHKHGLNRATADNAPRTSDNALRFDRSTPARTVTVVTNDEAPAAGTIPKLRISSDRVKSKEELLLLPDRYSVLSFDQNNAEDDDSSWWGRLYINGFPSSLQVMEKMMIVFSDASTFQLLFHVSNCNSYFIALCISSYKYFRSHFGSPPPTRAVKLVLASPLSMCDEVTGLPVLNNAEEIDELTVVVTMRGACTFGEKALVAHDIGAAGILFINNEDGLLHPSGPEARDIQMSTFMITQHDGKQLIQALTRVAEADSFSVLNGRFVPIMCKINADCAPVNWDDRRFESSLKYKGKILYFDDGVEFDGVQGEFGSWMNSLASWETKVPSDAHCCDKTSFEGSKVSNTTAVLCLRGECDFATKGENIAAAGAGMMIVASHNNTLTRMGCDPPIRGRKLNVSTIMVSADAYTKMFDSEVQVAFSIRMNQ
ncbi:hypothetical protein ACHAXR_011968 [Thalassiosira sp. AJA248-18]